MTFKTLLNISPSHGRTSKCSCDIIGFRLGGGGEGSARRFGEGLGIGFGGGGGEEVDAEGCGTF